MKSGHHLRTVFRLCVKMAFASTCRWGLAPSIRAAVCSRRSLRSSVGSIRTVYEMAAQAPADSMVDRVLHFWFGDSKDKYDISTDRSKLWFYGGPEIDAEVTTKFGADVEAALAGTYDSVIGGPRGLRGDLAIVILLDQFTRNIYRKKAAAFSGDAKALQIALNALDKHKEEMRTDLRAVERLFLMTPLMHSEDLDVQKKGVTCYEECLEDARSAGEKGKNVVEMFQHSVNFAKEHRDIIERFGRFPHRNEAHGRTSTPDELEFLKNGPRYGQ